MGPLFGRRVEEVNKRFLNRYRCPIGILYVNRDGVSLRHADVVIGRGRGEVNCPNRVSRIVEVRDASVAGHEDIRNGVTASRRHANGELAVCAGYALIHAVRARETDDRADEPFGGRREVDAGLTASGNGYRLLGHGPESWDEGAHFPGAVVDIHRVVAG